MEPTSVTKAMTLIGSPQRAQERDDLGSRRARNSNGIEGASVERTVITSQAVSLWRHFSGNCFTRIPSSISSQSRFFNTVPDSPF